MTISSAIILGLVISLIIIGVVLGYHDLLLKRIQRRYRKIRANQVIAKLERSGFFSLAPKEQLDQAKHSFKQLLLHKQSIKSIYAAGEDYSFDHRSFIVEYDIDKESIGIDRERFGAAARAAGLNVEFGPSITIDDDTVQMGLSVNDNKYTLCESVDDKEGSIAGQLARILNIELLKIRPEENVFCMGKHSSRLVILNDELKRYIMGG